MDFDGRSNKRRSDRDGGITQLQLPLLTDALAECEQLRAEIDQLRQENALLRSENLRLTSGSPIAKIAEPKPTYQLTKSVPSPAAVVPHAGYIQDMRITHGRKSSFWGQCEQRCRS
jgi:hypothetical protein